MRTHVPKVFISYSHADEGWKNRLVKQLRVLALEDVFDVWDDYRIAAGDDWRQELEGAMEQAQVAVFLVSADFLTSKFIRENEVPRILERRGDGLRVIPVIIHPCPWRRVSWLASIQGRPRDGQALALMPGALAEAALSAIAEEIADLLGGEEREVEKIGATSSQPLASLRDDWRITGLLSEAAKQLGDDRLAVRLGGIYALERIARDSKKDHWTVMEVLCAYVREKSQVRWEAEASTGPAADIQAILTVLGRRAADLDPEHQRLDLSGTNLSGADLVRANLCEAKLVGAILSNADLFLANLDEADLTEAVLSGAKLEGTSLRKATLVGEADLSEANLCRAFLEGANLTSANLSSANLSDADLKLAALTDANLIRTNLIGANLHGVGLSDADLSGADLHEVKNLLQLQIDAARGDAWTRLPPHLKRPAHWLKKL